MADLVLGIGTSHSPMLSMRPDQWRLRADTDRTSKYLVDPETGKPASYEQLLAHRQYVVDESAFTTQWESCQRAISTLAQSIRDARPDVLVIISDDQDELLYDDNMPMFQIYWGDSVRLIPRFIPAAASSDVKEWVWGYGDVELDIPVDTELARHLIASLREDEFDIACSRYLHRDYQYGGSIGPAGYVTHARVTAPRRQGIGHGWGFVIKRLLDNKPIPVVPIFQNTCYPPNTPTAKRCYKLGKSIARGIAAWNRARRVAVVASGGLSHFVTDETIDRLLIKGILEKDGGVLSSLPENRLQSAASEIKNWVTCAAVCESLDPELVDYVPVYRTEAGTGGGWGFMRWNTPAR
jgi:hypothetical protein